MFFLRDNFLFLFDPPGVQGPCNPFLDPAVWKSILSREWRIAIPTSLMRVDQCKIDGQLEHFMMEMWEVVALQQGMFLSSGIFNRHHNCSNGRSWGLGAVQFWDGVLLRLKTFQHRGRVKLVSGGSRCTMCELVHVAKPEGAF